MAVWHKPASKQRPTIVIGKWPTSSCWSSFPLTKLSSIRWWSWILFNVKAAFNSHNLARGRFDSHAQPGNYDNQLEKSHHLTQQEDGHCAMVPHPTQLVASHEAVVPRQTEWQTGGVGHQLNKWRPVVERWSSMLICQRPAITQRRPSFSSSNFTIGQPKSKHLSQAGWRPAVF